MALSTVTKEWKEDSRYGSRGGSVRSKASKSSKKKKQPPIKVMNNTYESSVKSRCSSQGRKNESGWSSPEKVSALTLKNLRRFDQLTKTF